MESEYPSIVFPSIFAFSLLELQCAINQWAMVVLKEYTMYIYFYFFQHELRNNLLYSEVSLINEWLRGQIAMIDSHWQFIFTFAWHYHALINDK